MNKLHVFTIMTNCYINFLEDQLNTLSNLFPDVEKTYTLITDSDKKIGTIDGCSSVNVKRIMDMPYSIVNLLKLSFVKDCLNDNFDDNDIFIFVDADTMFMKKSKVFWKKMGKILDNNDLILTYSPWYLVAKQEFANMLNDYECFASHYDINEKTIYCQTSFIAGKISILKELERKIYELSSKDLNYDNNLIPNHNKNEIFRHLPLAPEENYINKIINDDIQGKTNTGWKVNTDVYIKIQSPEFYRRMGEEKDIIKRYPLMFLYQKYDYGRKINKRNK